MDTTTNIGLRLPELDDAFSLEDHWNYNSQKIDDFAGQVNLLIANLTRRIEALEGNSEQEGNGDG